MNSDSEVPMIVNIMRECTVGGDLPRVGTVKHVLEMLLIVENVLKKHTGENLLQCGYCENYFGTASDCKKHNRTLGRKLISVGTVKSVCMCQ